MTTWCSKCGKLFNYGKNDYRWDYKSGGFDAKLVNCKYCEGVNVVDYWFPVDREEWYYTYEKKEN